MIAQYAAPSKTIAEYEREAYREVRDALADHEVEVLYAERNERKNDLRAKLIESKFVRTMHNSCRLWTGATSHGKDSSDSFGIIYSSGKSIPAHAVIYTIRGNKLPKGHVVAQTCGNLLCGEASHLYAKPKYNRASK